MIVMSNEFEPKIIYEQQNGALAAQISLVKSADFEAPKLVSALAVCGLTPDAARILFLTLIPLR